VAKALVTSHGESVALSRELGKGGEGSVFELSPESKYVAKIYHKLPDKKKQDKLSFMAATSSDKLLKYVAWPHATLKDARGGAIVGYLMPKVSNRAPIQMLYSPAHRRQNYPKAAWDFLLFIARNVAAAFEVLHAEGHVLGDVNQGNIMVGKDSTVIIIDSDSFQVNANGTVHFCEVGVSHFTPPELQGLSSFAGFRRTSNHDNFGLSLLIFHILFGGRHPYAGVPQRNGVGDALETDIKEFRYAYAKDSRLRGIAPPPRSIPTSILPADIEQMFHIAFTEQGGRGLRPTAAQWVVALDRLRSGLKKCATSAMHVYPGHLSHCAWCALENVGVSYFVDSGATYVRPATGFELGRFWALVEAIQSPTQIMAPLLSSAGVQAKPLPPEAAETGARSWIRIVAFLLGLLLVAESLKLLIPALLVVACGWQFGGGGENKERATEHRNRKQARDSAKANFDRLLQQVNTAFGPQGFLSKKADLVKLRDEYNSISEAEKRELSQLKNTAHERQRKKFLDQFFIDTASIPNVGAARKAALRSFGIETAADISKHAVMQVRGFGERNTRAMMDWRASCERRFTYNPAMAVTQADMYAIKQKFGSRAAQIEKLLEAGIGELKSYSANVEVGRNAALPSLRAAALQLEQAEKDLSVF
jgi:DNA-binding helix-hairpin-helix protein with protein kinase domain